MAFSEIFDPTFPPDTQAANQLGLDIRNFKTDFAQRLAAMTGSVGTPPAFEAIFAGIPFFDTTTGKVYQFTGTGFTEITPLILSNISEASIPLQEAIVAAIATIPASSPGPLVLPTGATVLTTPPNGDSTTKVATMAAVQQILAQAIPTVAGGALKIPLTFNSSGVPLTYVTIQGGLSATVAGGAHIQNVAVSFSPAYVTVIAAVATPNNLASTGTRGVSAHVIGLSTGGFTLTLANNDPGANLDSTDAAYWIAVGISN